MRNTAGFALAALVGAFGFWALERLTAPEASLPTADGTATGQQSPALVQETASLQQAGVLQQAGAPERGAAGQGGDELPARGGSVPRLVNRGDFAQRGNSRDIEGREDVPRLRPAMRPAFNPTDAALVGESSARRGHETRQEIGRRAGVAPAAARRESPFEGQRQLARGTFDSGDRSRGIRLLSSIYSVNKERSGVDLSPEVERLFREELSFARRLEYAEYLVRQGPQDALFEEQLDNALRDLDRVEREPQVAPAAWEGLSVAYLLAQSPAQRQGVLSALEPFLDRLVFARRYSQLLASYTVKSGDNLSRIASRFGTTVDAIKRLNRLEADVIQPRMRLRMLEGSVKIYVDKSDFRLWVTVDDRLLFEREVGLGRENATPEGEFVIRVRQKDPTWWRPGQAPVPAGDPANVLGSRWLGFRDTEEYAGFGIHGTADAATIGVESSAGCVRLRNEDVELLYDFIPMGTPVVVRY